MDESGQDGHTTDCSVSEGRACRWMTKREHARVKRSALSSLFGYAVCNPFLADLGVVVGRNRAQSREKATTTPRSRGKGGSVGGGAAQEGGVVAQERGQAPGGEFRLGGIHFQRHRFRQRRGHDSLIGETVAGQAFGGLRILG
jgi:hypothetical protein